MKRHPLMKLVGLHSHLGHAVTDTSSLVKNFHFLASLGAQVRNFPLPPASLHLRVSSSKPWPPSQLRADGWTDLDTLNLGGGPPIDYRRDGSIQTPTPRDIMSHVVSALRESTFPWRLWLEPGRSIVGNTGARFMHSMKEAAIGVNNINDFMANVKTWKNPNIAVSR